MTHSMNLIFKKVFLGSFIAFALALLCVSIVDLFISSVSEPKLKDIKNITLNGNIANAINIKDKVIIKKNITNANYLDSWKLSGTIIGKTSYIMVRKGREHKLLKLNDTLEEYKIKSIKKDKALFVEGNDQIWLYIIKKRYNAQNNIAKVIPKQGTIVIRSSQFKRTILKPERLLKSVNIMPEIQGGVFQGFKIKSLLEGSFLYMHGIRQDDIIKKINGKKLVSIADGLSAYQNISSNKKFSISVLRDNTIKELKYEVVK